VKHAVQVTICGQQFTLRSDASPAEAQRVAAFVNERIELARVHSSVDSLRTVILALFNVSGSYLRLRDSGACLDGETEQRLTALVEQMEEASRVAAPAEPGLFDS